MRLKVIAEAGDNKVGESSDGGLYGRFVGLTADIPVWFPIQGWSTLHTPGQPDSLEYSGPGIFREEKSPELAAQTTMG